ncbi:MAG: nucleotidyltransferase domain-containing protein [Candidatus Hodarchaeota archaeon]
MSRHPKDKDFVETKEGLLFTVVGYLHPPDAYTVYLKYRPDSEGRWERNGIRYRRMMQVYSAAEVQNSANWLREHYPDYVALDRVRGFELPLVPWKNLIAYYLPEVRLAEIIRNPQDPLESKTSSLVTLLSEESGVPENRFGITGSLLLDLHNPMFSDIDLLVYGRENAHQLRNAMDDLFGENKVKPYSPEEIQGWQQRQVNTLGIPSKYSESIAWSFWQRGRFDQTVFSISPVRTDAEIMNQYGREMYSAIETVEVTATIIESRDNLFVPARYLVGDITIEEGDVELPALTEVTSFEGIFSSVFNEGDRVRIRGTAEAVRDADGNLLRNQVVVGTLATQGWIIRIPTT